MKQALELNPAAAQTAPEPFIDKHEAVKRLSCGYSTLDTWMKRGFVPYYKIAKKVVFKWSEVEAALRATCHVNEEVAQQGAQKGCAR